MITNLEIKKSNLSDIKQIAEWYKNKEVKKWIYIDDWNEYFNAVSDNENYYIFSIYKNENHTHIFVLKICVW